MFTHKNDLVIEIIQHNTAKRDIKVNDMFWSFG